MATSPLQSTEWAVEDVGNGINTTDNKVPTTLPHKRFGWGFPEPPGRNHFNYWMNAMHLWKEYFKTTLEEGGLLTQNFNILTEESDYSNLSIVVGAGIVLLDRDTSDQTFRQSVKTTLSITPSVTAYISIRSDTGVVAETSDLDGGGAYDLIPLYRVTSSGSAITQVIDLRSPLNSNANAVKDLEDDIVAINLRADSHDTDLATLDSRADSHDTDLAALQSTGGGPAGTVQMYAAPTAPVGYLECNGAAVSRTTYSALFAAIGVTWGAGNGTTTFDLPDMRGEFARGWDHGRGIDSGRGFATAQSDEFEAHTHSSNTLTAGSSGGISQGFGGGSSPNNASTTTSTGGTETRPRNIALMYIIKT